MQSGEGSRSIAGHTSGVTPGLRAAGEVAWATGVHLPFDKRSTELTPKAQGKRGRDVGRRRPTWRRYALSARIHSAAAFSIG